MSKDCDKTPLILAFIYKSQKPDKSGWARLGCKQKREQEWEEAAFITEETKTKHLKLIFMLGSHFGHYFIFGTGIKAHKVSKLTQEPLNLWFPFIQSQ